MSLARLQEATASDRLVTGYFQGVARSGKCSAGLWLLVVAIQYNSPIDPNHELESKMVAVTTVAGGMPHFVCPCVYHAKGPSCPFRAHRRKIV